MRCRQYSGFSRFLSLATRLEAVHLAAVAARVVGTFEFFYLFLDLVHEVRCGRTVHDR